MDYAVLSDFLSSDEVATMHMEWISYIPAELAIDWKYSIIIYNYVLSYVVCGLIYLLSILYVASKAANLDSTVLII